MPLKNSSQKYLRDSSGKYMIKEVKVYPSTISDTIIFRSKKKFIQYTSIIPLQ